MSVAKTILEQDEAATVTVFDARALCSGATGRNGGQLAINAAESYLKLKKMVGMEMAGKIIHFNIKTLEALRRIAAQLALVQDPEVTDVVKIRSFIDEESFRRVQGGIEALEADHPSLRGLYTVLDPEACRKVRSPSPFPAVLSPIASRNMVSTALLAQCCILPGQSGHTG